MSFWDDVGSAWSAIWTADQAVVPGASAVNAAATDTASAVASAATLSTFIGDLTDGSFWRSLGWLLLGIILLGLGLALLLRKPIESAAGEVAKAVAL
jgi:hypothetical protein